MLQDVFHLDYERPYLYPKQFAAIFEPKRISVIEASAQPLDCVVQTPEGPRLFGSLKVEDRVFSVDGSVTTVTGVYPKGVQPVYRLTFIDGASTRASGDHLWRVMHPRDGTKTITTDKIRSWAINTRKVWRFPIAAAVDYPKRPVPIDPWLLGVLIGDGSLCGNALSISSADLEIVERVRRTIPQGYKLVDGGEYSYRIVAKQRGAGYEKAAIRFKADAYEVAVAGRYIGRVWSLDQAMTIHAEAMRSRYGDDLPIINLRQELRALGLLGLKHNEKFVPDIYLRNAVEVRLEILRGIMDTDGSGGSANGGIIEQTSERLAANIREIVYSLGGVSRTAVTPPRQKGWKTSYRINLRHNDIESFFWLPRKKFRTKSLTKVVRTLSKIERLPDAEVQCISVDHPSKLYLTDDYIATHNTKGGKTSGCIVWLIEQALACQPGQNCWWVAPVSDQALIAFRRTMRSLPSDMFTPNISLKTITLANGVVLWFKSGDKPNSLYGEDVYAVVIDEASRMKEDAYIAVRSTVTYTRGKIRLIGNVRGRKNFFFKLARRAEHGDAEMGYHKIVAADAVAAGVLDAKEIEDARSQMPEQSWRELYLAEASDDGGNPFGLQHIAACVVPSLSSGAPTVWGWDLAKRQDYTVGIALDAAGYVCRLERFQHMPWDHILENIIRMTRGVPALVDSTGVGDPIVDFLQKRPGGRFEGYHFTQASKQKLMEGLAVAIQSRNVTFPPGVIVNELEQFEFEYTRNGCRYSAPTGYNDDAVCALALAIMHKALAPKTVRVTSSMLEQVLAMPRRR